MGFRNPIAPGASVSGFIFANRDEGIKVVDEARYALAEDLIYSQQMAKGGYVKGVGAASRSKPKYNLTGDPYFTDGFRLVLMLDRRPRSLLEIESFNWENPVSSRLKRLEVNRQGDFDEGQ